MPTFNSDQDYLNWFANLSPADQLLPQNQSPTISPGREVYVEVYAGGTSDGTTQDWARNATLTRTNVGRWTVSLDSPHPDGTGYHISTQAQEESGNRDTPDITTVQGTLTANGFDIQIVTGDNGGSADVYVDTPWTFGITAPVELP